MTTPKNLPGKKKPGPKKPHSGQFKKGGDPRQMKNPPRPGNQVSGYRIKQALNQVIRMTQNEVQMVREDESEPVARRLAADRVLIAMGQGQRADKAFEQIADRTDGKPAQSHEIKVEQVVDPAAVHEDILRKVRWGEGAAPEEAEALEGDTPPALPSPDPEAWEPSEESGADHVEQGTT